MKLQDTTNPACNTQVRTIFNSESAGRQFDLLARLRFVVAGLYYSDVGPEWSSHHKLESDYMHHIEIAIAGRRRIVFCGDVLHIKPGLAYWFPGNTPLERCWHEPSRVLYVKMRCEWLPGVDPLLDWPERRPLEIGPFDLTYWQNWLRPRPRPTTNELLQFQSRISDCVAMAVPNLEQVIGNHLQTHSQFQKVFEIIEEKLGANLRVEELARAYGTSIHAFSMAFTRNTGISPKAYLKRRLNQEAVQLITSTVLKFKEIAEKLKFCDEYHFNRFFSQANGQPPLRYRRAFAQSDERGQTSQRAPRY